MSNNSKFLKRIEIVIYTMFSLMTIILLGFWLFFFSELDSEFFQINQLNKIINNAFLGSIGVFFTVCWLIGLVAVIKIVSFKKINKNGINNKNNITLDNQRIV